MAHVSLLLPHRLTNLLQSLLLVAALVLLMWGLGWLFAGSYGVIWATMIGVVPLTASVRLFPLMALKLYGARPLSPQEAPRLHALLCEICNRTPLQPPPRLHYIASELALIFSVGRGKNAAIAVSAGILRLLSLRDLYGVLAHEVSHIKNGDTLVMSLADVASRVTAALSFAAQVLILVNLPLVMLGNVHFPWLPLLLMLLAPTLSALLQLALSRTREYGADLQGALITGDPRGLAAALEKIEEHQARLITRLIGPRRDQPSLLRTHPATPERIRRLLELEVAMHPHEKKHRPFDELAAGLPPHLDRPLPPPRRRFPGIRY